MADDTTEAGEPTPNQALMDAIDNALAPAARNNTRLGVVSFQDLAHQLACFRQALSHIVNGPPPPPPPAPPSEEPVLGSPNAPLEPNLADAAATEGEEGSQPLPAAETDVLS